MLNPTTVPTHPAEVFYRRAVSGERFGDSACHVVLVRLLRRLFSREHREHVHVAHVPSAATARGGYTMADVEELRGTWRMSAPGSHLIEESVDDPTAATMPSPKMLREAANVLETAPYRRMKTAAWLRYVAGQVEELDREEAAEGLDDRTLADIALASGCREVGPEGYVCTEPIPHNGPHRAHLDDTVAGRVEVDAWVTPDLPFLAEEQARGTCAAVNK